MSTPSDEDVAQSVGRIRRGCFGVAALIGAMAVLLTTSTGNLFFLTLLLGTLALLALSRLVK